MLTQYVDQCIAAIETGKFLYIAHPDVMHYEGDAVFYQREMERLCRRAKELGIPLEMNLLGLGDGRHYPNPLFWEIASSVGNSVVLGADAHFPQHVYRKETVAKAKNMLRHLGLELIESIL